ncbi:MAG: hypothetical protein IT376_00905 [Polyangiaceae bacterium]|nr:hypothetical protein [Polyangiaceae bacterium]
MHPFARPAIVCAALVAGACGHGRDDPPTCNDGPHAAFEVRVSALGARLPTDATLAVRYGGGTEEVSLAAPPASPRVVFCATELADGGTEAGADAGAEPRPLAAVCELWTSGAADVTVTASGYAPLERDLVAERDECGIRTVEVELTLGSDAGG